VTSGAAAAIEEAVRAERYADALRLADEALAAGDDADPRALLALAAAYGATGSWSSAAAVYDRVEGVEAALLAAIARLLTGEVGATPEEGGPAPFTRALALLWSGLRDTLTPSIVHALERLTEAARLAESRPDAVLPDSPSAMAAAVACELLELDAAALLASRGTSTRHRLLGAWVALRAGRWADAQRVLDGLDAASLGARDAVVAAAVEAGLALRSGDLDRLLAARERVVRAVTLHPVDVLSLPLFAELIAAALRLEALGDLGRFEATSAALLGRLADAPLWLVAATWARFRAAAMAGDVERARAESARLSTAVVPRLAPLVAAASAWLDVLDGRVDRAAVEAAASGLESVGLRWESAQLVGAAAVRTSDPSVARALLTRARDVRQSLPALTGEGGAGSVALTEREREIGACLLDGMSHKEIGAHLFIAAKTVEHHVARIRVKLGAKSKAELLTLLRRELSA